MAPADVTIVSSPVLMLDKTASVSTVRPGETISYSISDGSDTATQTATLPVTVSLELVVGGDGRRQTALLQLQAVALRLHTNSKLS